MIYNFKQFVKESYFIQPEQTLFNIVLEDLYNSILTTKEQEYITEYLSKNDIKFEQINENFFDKLKVRYDNAKKVATDIADQAKDALQKVVTAAKNVVEFVTNTKNQLSQYIKSILTDTKDKVKGKLKSNAKFVQEVKTTFNKDKSALIKDLSTCSDVAKFYKDEFVQKISDTVSKSLSGFLSKNDEVVQTEPVAERLQYLTEASNMIDKLVHGISHVPPFSWLHQIAHLGEKGATSVIAFLSSITHKLGGPEFALPVIAAILGIAFEYNIKGLAKHGLLDVIEFFTIPYIALVIKLVAYIATFLAGYEVTKEIVSSIDHEFAMAHNHH